ETIFALALERPGGADREAFLAAGCARGGAEPGGPVRPGDAVRPRLHLPEPWAAGKVTALGVMSRRPGSAGTRRRWPPWWGGARTPRGPRPRPPRRRSARPRPPHPAGPGAARRPGG